jgi:AcrR family transcriptional regulator
MTTVGNRVGHDVPMTEQLELRRTAVLEAAARLYAEEGPHALSVRRVSTAAGGSTQLLYTLFGGMPGFADALYREAYDRLARRMDDAGFEDIPRGDPARLATACRAYRGFAASEPGFFSVMFGRVVAEFRPSAQARAAGAAKTFGRVVRATQDCIDAGTLRADSALLLAASCWAAGHGLASLQANAIIGVNDALLDAAQADAIAENLLKLILDAHRP